MSEISKARSISDAQIEFVSLVDKAANKKSFLIAKAENGKANFSAFGKIVKTDSENHYVTGVVYEPLTEDSQGDFMTEDEIQKAAVWFAKNGRGVDLQHNFEKFENAAVVESMVTKSDCEIGREKIRKGTWLMTVEIADPDVWSAVEKGEITGFSMGGRGVYGERDIDLDNAEKLGLLKRLMKALGFEDEEKKEENMTREEVKKLIASELAKFKEAEKDTHDEEPHELEKGLEDELVNKLKSIAGEVVREIVGDKQKEESVTKEDVAEMVAKALEPLYKARGIATNLGNEPEPVQKEDGVFSGLFM